MFLEPIWSQRQAKAIHIQPNELCGWVGDAWDASDVGEMRGMVGVREVDVDAWDAWDA